MRRPSKPDRALGTLFIAGLSAVGFTLAVSARNPLFGLTGWALGLFSGVAAINRVRADGYGFEEYEAAIVELSDSYAEGVEWVCSSPPGKLAGNVVVTRIPPPIRELLERSSQLDAQRFWRMIDEILKPGQSTMVAGAGGSGKTTWMSALVARWTTQNPDGRLMLGDPHYSRDGSKWQPGMNREYLEKHHLARDINQIIALCDEACRIMEYRRDNGLENEYPVLLVVDEFMMIKDEYPAEGKRIGALLGKVMRQARKYKVDVIIGMHSLKSSQNDLDSGVIQRMNLIVLGDMLEDPTLRLPASLSDPAMLSRRAAMGKWAAIVRQAMQSPKPVNPPRLDVYLESINIEVGLPTDPVDRWILQNEATVAELYAAGLTSVRQITDRLGIHRSKDNPENQAVHRIVKKLQNIKAEGA